MNIFTQAWDFCETHGTKFLGVLQTLDMSLLVAKAQFPTIFNNTVTTYLAAAGVVIGVWTVKRGVYNSQQIAAAVTAAAPNVAPLANDLQNFEQIYEKELHQ